MENILELAKNQRLELLPLLYRSLCIIPLALETSDHLVQTPHQSKFYR